MHAMIFEKVGKKLRHVEVPVPMPNEQEVLIKIYACGICRTDLHIIDGELKNPRLPLILGHQIIGEIAQLGKNVSDCKVGDRVGIPWLGDSCGSCEYCLSDQENLCDDPKFTGYQINGGFAEYCVANANFCFPIVQGYTDLEAAPLLCAGLIGFRCFRKAGNTKRLGIYGFGSAAHILIQVARFYHQDVYVFTKADDFKAQRLARELGAKWVGSSTELPPELLDAAIIFAPDGQLVPIALRAVKKGGIVICGGIHMTNIPSFPYETLWGERILCSVANLTKHDGIDFLKLAPKIPIKTEVNIYPLKQVNEALDDLRNGRFTGAAVIQIGEAMTKNK